MIKFAQCLFVSTLYVSQLLSYPDTIRLTYEIGETALLPSHIVLLSAALDPLASRDNVEVSIIGSADYLGNVEINRTISDLRVRHVVDFITTGYSNNIDVMLTDSRGEVNSHLEDQLGTEGASRDRSVIIIIDKIEALVEIIDKGVAVTTTKTEDISNLDVGQSLVLENLNFYPGSHKLLPKSVPILKKLTEELWQHPNIAFEIQGHICCFAHQTKAFSEQNKSVSEEDLPLRRSRNIYNFLVNQGIDTNRISIATGAVVNDRSTGSVEEHATARKVLIRMQEGPQELRSEIEELSLAFRLGRSMLVPESIPTVRSLLGILQKDKSISLTFVGHSCCSPECSLALIDGLNSDTGRNDLSTSRAQIVYNYLKKEGIDPARMTFKGYAFSQPMIFPEQSEEDQISNRRVVIKITGIAQ